MRDLWLLIRKLMKNNMKMIYHFYLAILSDRATSKPIIIASTEGGVDIEEVAEKSPEKITKILIDPSLGIRPYQARQVAFSLGLSGDSFKQCVKLVSKLYDFFWVKDCSQVEVNPLVLTPTGDVLALDAKVNFDAKIIVDNLNKTFKATEKLFDTFYSNRVMYFQYRGMRIPALFVFPDQATNDKAYKFSYTDNNKITITFQIEIETYFPSFDKTTEMFRGNVIDQILI